MTIRVGRVFTLDCFGKTFEAGSTLREAIDAEMGNNVTQRKVIMDGASNADDSLHEPVPAPLSQTDEAPKTSGLPEASSESVNSPTQEETGYAAAAIYDFEQSLKDALTLVRLAHSIVSRTFEGDGGGAHPALGLMEISQRALAQANDAARYARHALSAVIPYP